jgi:O-glycosyl hydrolase
LATLWQPPLLSQPGAFAFRIYRNYDQAGAKFGDTSVAATSSDQALLSIYAAQRSSDNALTLVIINKSGAEQSAALTLDNFNASGPAQLYRYSSANLNAIVRGSDLAITNGEVTATYPANSITLLVIPQGDTTPPPAAFDSWLRLPLTWR